MKSALPKHHERHAAGTVAFVGDFLEPTPRSSPVPFLIARSTFSAGMLVARLDQECPQPRVAVGVPAARLGCERDIALKTGKDLALA